MLDIAVLGLLAVAPQSTGFVVNPTNVVRLLPDQGIITATPTRTHAIGVLVQAGALH